MKSKTHFLIHALSAATLALGLTGIAQADANITTFVPLTLGAGSSQAGSFTNTISTAGAFVDNYIFANAPSYSLDQYLATVASGITFTGAALVPYMDSDPADAIDLTTILTSTGLSASPSAVLPSGLYVLELSGTALAGGSYTLNITSTATDAPGVQTPVPEPATWLLMGMGLALTGVVKRRRMKS